VFAELGDEKLREWWQELTELRQQAQRAGPAGRKEK
jgi:hypothetical protein